MPISAKALKKINETISVALTIDQEGYQLPADLLDCLADEPVAMTYFNSLTNGHRNYFGKWIDAAKTSNTRTKRIALAVNALGRKWGYPEMIRAAKKVNKAGGDDNNTYFQSCKYQRVFKEA
jgi:hypothetical protein